jgi:DNA-binding GntR family transcriptional regulator
VVGAAHQLTRVHWEVSGKPARISEEWERRHAAFHKALTAACGSGRLVQLRAQFFNQTNRYRRLAVAFSKIPRDDRGEHRALTEVALARDAAKAESLIRQHIHRTAEDVRAIYAAQDERLGGESAHRKRRTARAKRQLRR